MVYKVRTQGEMLERMSACYIDADFIGKINNSKSTNEILEVMADNNDYSVFRCNKQLINIVNEELNHIHKQGEELSMFVLFLGAAFVLGIALIDNVSFELFPVLILWSLWLVKTMVVKKRFAQEKQKKIIEACNELSLDIALNFCYLEKMDGLQAKFDSLIAENNKNFTVRDGLDEAFLAFRNYVDTTIMLDKKSMFEIKQTLLIFHHHLYNNFKDIKDIGMFHKHIS